MIGPAPLREFYLTFARKYARISHPTCEQAHPDGWVTIEARDEPHARYLAWKHFGPAWCTIYDRPLTKDLFPKGELIRVTPESTPATSWAVR